MRCLPLLLATTVGCAYISDEDQAWRLDPDGDGVRIGEDCDDESDALGAPVVFYADADGDGYGDAGTEETACTQPEGFVVNADDCDDTNADAFPGNDETWYDGVDADCAGDDDFDQDGDGFANDVDCDDTDPDQKPDDSVEEIYFNGVDDNCDLSDADGDQDGDGFWAADYVNQCNANSAIPMAIPAGADGDCWDNPGETPADFVPINDFPGLTAAEVNPSATETWYDAVDADCAGDDDFDQDGDFARTEAFANRSGAVGNDCDDTEPTTYPGADDDWYDGVDSDCGGNDDFDRDGDGFLCSAEVDSRCSGDDCVDTDVRINPGMTDLWYDGIDSDCGGNDDFDRDGDGYACSPDVDVRCSADDCDDGDLSINPGATEVWYDGTDQDCSGTSDYDQDEDGYDLVDYGGADCDDEEPLANPGQTEIEGDGFDNDCSGDSNGNAIDGQQSAAEADGIWLGLDSPDSAGWSVAAAGDVNGDSREDWLVAAPAASSSAGAVYLLTGPATAASIQDLDEGTADVAGSTGSRLGVGLTALGDLDGDGFDDVAMGAPDSSTGSGRAYVVLGPFSGGSSATLLADGTYRSGTGNQTVGWSLAAGDLDNDGVVDLAIGAPFDDWDGTDGGRLFVEYGPLTTTATVGGDVEIDPEDGTGDELGDTVLVGDLTGDGIDDVVVGAPQAGTGGCAYTLYGPVTLGGALRVLRDDRICSSDSGADFGTAGSLGDVDNDGRVDLLVGAPDARDSSGSTTGAAYLWTALPASSSTASADATFVGRTSGSDFGIAVAAGGDLDGTTGTDVVVGAMGDTNTYAFSGVTYVFLGVTSGTSVVSSTHNGLLHGDSANDAFGSALATGDSDNDGFDDLLIGAYRDSANGSAAGAAALFLGGSL